MRFGTYFPPKSSVEIDTSAYRAKHGQPRGTKEWAFCFVYGSGWSIDDEHSFHELPCYEKVEDDDSEDAMCYRRMHGIFPFSRAVLGDEARAELEQELANDAHTHAAAARYAGILSHQHNYVCYSQYFNRQWLPRAQYLLEYELGLMLQPGDYKLGLYLKWS